MGTASLSGAARVLVIGAPDARLALSRELGADASWDVTRTTEDERREEILALTGGRGPDVVIEAAGHPSTIGEALRLVRDGGTYVVVGHYTDAGETAINPHTDINRKHVDIRGQWGTDFHHLARALTLFARHRDRLPFRKLIGERYGLEETGRALEDVAALRVTKAIIEPGR